MPSAHGTSAAASFSPPARRAGVALVDLRDRLVALHGLHTAHVRRRKRSDPPPLGVDSSVLPHQDDGYVVGLVRRSRVGGNHRQGYGHEHLCPIRDARISDRPSAARRASDVRDHLLGPAADGAFQLDAIRRLAANDAVELSTTQWTPFVLSLEELPDDGDPRRLWRAEVPIRIDRAGARTTDETLWLRPLISGVAFDQSAAALKERLVSYNQPPALATFLVPEPPSRLSAFVSGRELQPFEIDDEGLVRLQVTFRSDDRRGRRGPSVCRSGSNLFDRSIGIASGTTPTRSRMRPINCYCRTRRRTATWRLNCSNESSSCGPMMLTRRTTTPGLS